MLVICCRLDLAQHDSRQTSLFLTPAHLEYVLCALALLLEQRSMLVLWLVHRVAYVWHLVSLISDVLPLVERVNGDSVVLR